MPLCFSHMLLITVSFLLVCALRYDLAPYDAEAYDFLAMMLRY